VYFLQDCINELEEQKLHRSSPHMNLVILMPFSSNSFAFSTAAATASNISSSRDDVLFVAAAGNKGQGVTDYPAGFDAVVSVAAVDPVGNRAAFSQFNYDVEW